MTQPISAPPANPEALESQRYIEEDGSGRYADDEQYREWVATTQKKEAERVVASAHVPSRVIMRVSNRYNWQHFYTMPADVGYQNVPGLIRAMQEEGCKITDIQITFEVQEMK